MEKTSAYELTIIYPKSVKSEAGKKTIKNIEETIEEIGQLTNKDNWGLKKLAYPIADHNRAYYTFFEFEADPEKISQLDNKLELDDNIIRQLLIVKE